MQLNRVCAPENIIPKEEAASAGTEQMAFRIGAFDSNGMKSENPRSGIYKTEASATLDKNGGTPACNQGGMAVVSIEGKGSRPSHQGAGFSEEKAMFTLNAVEKHGIAYEERDTEPTAYATQACGDRDNPSQSYQKEKAYTLPANPMSDRDQAVIKAQEPTSYRGDSITSKANASNPKPGDPCHTLSTDERNYICIGQELKEEPIILESNQNHATTRSDGISTILPASMGMGGGYIPMVTEKEPQAAKIFDTRGKSQNTQIAPTISGDGVDCRAGTEAPQKSGTLQSTAYKSLNTNNVARIRSVVRRLTPMECERLQGYPDHWTDIGDWIDSKGKKHKGDSDAPRYKALGNSIALPFWEWLAERIIDELEKDGESDPTMASLFDGIGGFPLVFSRHGARPVWASEIEEFPIAVTKIRFPEEQEEQEERR